ncbi:MAG: helix-turn-helix domain-containing protein [Catenulispora sp.]|nr:helix-turn-helix domain-containing protein [Catenulispora sp.]
MTPRTPMYRPVSRQLIRQLMRRTGDGGPVSVRQLAADAGVARSTVGGLLTGDQDSVPEAAARSMAQRLGVDLLVAFEEVCRSTTSVTEYAALVRTSDEVSA